VKTRAGRFAFALLGILVVAFAARFWAHDALPYITDYAEESYRRYWQVRRGLLVHIAGGSVALFAGPLQLWTGLQRRFRRLHRGLGYAYISGIVISASSSFYLALYTRADFGLALAILAVAWLASIAMALIAVRNRRIDVHQEWMIRSYIVTFSFVSYRFLVSLSMFQGLGPSRPAMVLWISWVVPMMLFELFIQRNRIRPLKRPTTAPAPREFV
jgi:uncharacterized membrane protein